MGWTRWHGNILKQLTDEQVSQALVETGHVILQKSQDLVPLDEGTLQETGMVKLNPNNDHEVAISYGGGFGTPHTRVPYAVKQHEVPMNHTDGRKHNYLRDPVNNTAPRALKKILIKKLSQTW